MKRRLIIFFLCLVLACGAILGVALLLDSRAGSYFSSPDEIRFSTFAEYDDLFTQTPGLIPDLSTASSFPKFTIDDSKAGEVKVKWNEEEADNNIAMFGDRIAADPVTQSVTLPNGQVIRLVAIAHSPGLKKLFDRDDPDRWGQRGEVTWHDPISMQPIEDPESLGLDREVDVDEHQALMFAFQCSDTEARPVRWLWLRVHDERTKALVANSSSRQSNVHGIVTYRHRLKIFHNTSLRILLPIAFGETEVKQVDLNETGKKVRFGDDAVEISILATQAGEQNSRSFSGGNMGGESMSIFRYRDPKPDREWNQSFSLVSVWPQVQGHHLQYFDSKKDKWYDFHPNSVINSAAHNQKLKDLGKQQWRRFPAQARGVFELKEIPGLPKLNNLFMAEIGPIRFDYDNQFREAIAGPTLLEWRFRDASIPSDEFPIVFDDPTVTPARLLAEYERIVGMKIDVNQADHQITGERDSLLDRLKSWWEKTRSRLFP